MLFTRNQTIVNKQRCIARDVVPQAAHQTRSTHVLTSRSSINAAASPLLIGTNPVTPSTSVRSRSSSVVVRASSAAPG